MRKKNIASITTAHTKSVTINIIKKFLREGYHYLYTRKCFATSQYNNSSDSLVDHTINTNPNDDYLSGWCVDFLQIENRISHPHNSDWFIVCKFKKGCSKESEPSPISPAL